MTLLDEIAIEFGASPSEIYRLVASAPRRYKSYEIDKRDGGKRLIAQPARELKKIQWFVATKKLAAFPIHEIAAAYVAGKGIYDNALMHAESDVILKLDFRSFFPSIVPTDLERLNRRTKPQVIPSKDLETYYKILFWGEGSSDPKRLSIGAPSSPMLSNIIMFQADTEIFGIANDLGLVVSRYADDITVSGKSYAALERFERRLRTYLKSLSSPKLMLNEAKRGMYSRGERRMVTGLVLTPDHKVSLGRDRKRLISALVHKVKIGDASHDSMMYAKGMLGFVISAEPKYMDTLRKKYGSEVIDFILAVQAS